MSYFRPEIDRMTGYVPGEQPQTAGFIKLNTNENPYPPSPRVIEAIQRSATDRLRLYPDPVANRFRETAGALLGVSADWILACNGSDDALTILTRACVGAGEEMVAPIPSYGLYPILADIQGCRFRGVPFREDGTLPADFVSSARLAVITNPNAPTGTVMPTRALLELASSAQCLVVVDEAYADFAEENAVSAVRECERLAVTRTLSKSYSLAGIRFGFIVAQPAIIEALMKVKDSYNCDAVAIAAAVAALEDQDYFRETRQKILATRARLSEALGELGFAVTPSSANFVWIQRAEPVRPIFEALKARKILIRYFGNVNGREGLRISVGTDDETDRLLAELRTLV